MSKGGRIKDKRYDIFGAAVTVARTTREWSKKDLERESQVNRGVIGDIENGNSKYKPHEKTIAKICTALGMDAPAWIKWLSDPHGLAPNGESLQPIAGNSALENVVTHGEMTFKTSTGMTLMMQITTSGVTIVIKGIKTPKVHQNIVDGDVQLRIAQAAAQMSRQA